ncbi:ABC transporter ATP-binding protein [Diplocloster modestus]|uniref:ABC transporter ATP-binding protein n=1 Tax=Diplocloster modestus TaxID=2850322 RepID=A0ABS6K4T4_9FIRM|nr:ABC transporter ATP-binding protein [Diplocloster modestus]MBU9725524.1 ABC transporter ATP-binding protein [Diplocloster modestus]
MKSIRFEHIEKSYGKNTVIRDLNLEIRSGERVILLGPSGCGKTTTLRMISGLESVTSGNLYMGGEVVNDVDSGDRNVAMVFQNYALFPHMSVYKNIAFGLRTYKLKKDAVREKVSRIMHVLELDGLQDRLPRELSGGQRQRVALARAAVKQADYFLLDEPLSNLDAQLRVQARKELVRLHEMYHPTFVYVTHDQIEAMTIGQKVVLMYRGDIQMADTPYNIYYRPANVFTARFIGSPPMNIVPGRLTGREVLAGDFHIPLTDPWLKRLERYQGQELLLGIRPEEMRLTMNADSEGLRVTPKYIENYGNRLGVYCMLGDAECIASVEQGSGLSFTGRIFLVIPPDKISFFDPKTEENLGYPVEYLPAEGDALWDAEQKLSGNIHKERIH